MYLNTGSKALSDNTFVVPKTTSHPCYNFKLCKIHEPCLRPLSWSLCLITLIMHVGKGYHEKVLN